ncbi:MAG: VOC family protein [Chlorobiaceae bacterium]|nr:VOC family protein [Chlorobiaceae bacterium]NTW74303.1 VOC family protein [Chlorobiaceae bacterium]
MSREQKECNPAAWFEIPVTDMARAAAFYESVFRWPIKLETMADGMVMGWFPMSESAYGASGSLVKGRGYVPTLGGAVLYFSEQDIDGALDRVRQNGGNVITDKTDIGVFGFYAWFEDSEGNRIGLHSMS